MKKVCVVGHFAKGKNLLNGQTIKTKIITTELENLLGKDQVEIIDTHGGIKAYIKLPFQIFMALKSCYNIVIFPAHNGVKVIVPIINVLNIFFKKGCHYVVIGGWLPELIKSKKILKSMLKRLNGIYVETNTMKNNLLNQGFSNVRVMPNCKDIKILNEDELIYSNSEPYRLCTFSRVMKEKGIEEAINAVTFINRLYGRTVYTLDIYGQVDPNNKEWFCDILNNLPSYIQYKGFIPYDKSVEELKSYFALLFPTLFYTEGIPGTVIDAYAAGVPVISSKWESFSDIIDDGVTGMGFGFNCMDEFHNILMTVAETPEILNRMKVNCLQKASEYSTHDVVRLFWKVASAEVNKVL